MTSECRMHGWVEGYCRQCCMQGMCVCVCVCVCVWGGGGVVAREVSGI